MSSPGKRSPAQTAALYGVLTALGLILSYVESLLPVFFAVPGIKLGLANLTAFFALYQMRARDAWIVSFLRIGLASLLFGSGVTWIYSCAGGVLSLVVMQLARKSARFSPVGVSVCGGVAHNAGQILAAALLMGTGRLVWYFPVLCISGVAAGAAVGAVGGILIRRVEKSWNKTE